MSVEIKIPENDKYWEELARAILEMKNGCALQIAVPYGFIPPKITYLPGTYVYKENESSYKITTPIFIKPFRNNDSEKYQYDDGTTIKRVQNVLFIETQASGKDIITGVLSHMSSAEELLCLISKECNHYIDLDIMLSPDFAHAIYKTITFTSHSLS